MIQTQEDDKKPSFGPNFGPFGPNSGHQIFFSKIQLRKSLDIMVSYHHENLVTDGQNNRQRDQ